MSEYAFPRRLEDRPAVPPLEERLTPAAAAEYVGVSVDTLRNWRSQSKGPAFYRIGRVFYWRLDLDRWIASRRVECQ